MMSGSTAMIIVMVVMLVVMCGGMIAGTLGLRRHHRHRPEA